LSQITKESGSGPSLQEAVDCLDMLRTYGAPTQDNKNGTIMQTGRVAVAAYIPKSMPLSDVKAFLSEIQSLMSDVTNETGDSEIVNRVRLVKLPSGMQVSDLRFIPLPPESRETPIDDHFI